MDLYKHICGPTPSRRLGFALAVDLIPPKTCNHNCNYCQLGPTKEYTVERKSFVPLDDVIAELDDFLGKGSKIDFITFPGSGEPTLSFDLGRALTAARQRGYPTALFTFGQLLYREDVLCDVQNASIILPTFLSANKETYYKIARPHPSLNFEDYLSGLEQLKLRYSGEVWLAVMLLNGLNDSPEELQNTKEWIEKIQPDRVQLTSAHRPSLVDTVAPLDYEAMMRARAILGAHCEILGDFQRKQDARYSGNATQMILNIIQRRPASTDELQKSLGLDVNELEKIVLDLVNDKKVEIHAYGSQRFLSLKEEKN